MGTPKSQGQGTSYVFSPLFCRYGLSLMLPGHGTLVWDQTVSQAVCRSPHSLHL